MKKPLPTLMLVLLAVAALCAGCAPANAQDKHMIATFFPVYVAALNVVGDVGGVALDALAPPTAGCLHDYQMTTADRQRVEEADIVVLNGLELEGFLDKVLGGKEAIDASQGYDALEAAFAHHHGDEEHDDEEHDDDHHPLNAHVWTSPAGAIWQAERIRDGLIAADPVNAEAYGRNASAYIEKLEALQADLRERLAPVKGEKVVLLHDSMAYFAREYGLEVVAVLKEDPESQLSAKELIKAAQAVREQGARALFGEVQYADAAVETLSRETGVPAYDLDAAVTGELNDPDAYLKAMAYNADVVLRAFGL